MELLTQFDVSVELSKNEFIRRLDLSSADHIRELRMTLFLEAVDSGLADCGDELVPRRKVGGGKSVKEKHTEDIWEFVGAIRRCELIPRTLLKNGKRSKVKWLKSQMQHRRSKERGKESGKCGKAANTARSSPTGPLDVQAVEKKEDLSVPEMSAEGDGKNTGRLEFEESRNRLRELKEKRSNTEPILSMQGGRAVAVARTSAEVDDVFFRSTIVKSINALRMDMDALRAEVKGKSGNQKCVPAIAAVSMPKGCSLYVRGPVAIKYEIGKLQLENLLGCEVWQYTCVRKIPVPAFKVKIVESYQKAALDGGQRSGCFVAPWRNSRAPLPNSGVPSQHVSECDIGRGCGACINRWPQGGRRCFKITAWNCRGLSNSLPYLEELIAGGSKVVALSEHWLWPYDLCKLNQVNDDYNSVGKADGRLTEDARGGRGCGGVGIHWHKSIVATTISGIASDHMCGIRFSVNDGCASLMSVIAVYLPCLDQGMDCYREHMLELEHVVAESERMGPVVVLGDFNAHLGGLGGVRGVGDMNPQWILLREMMDRCNLSAVSLGCMSSGPAHTYQNSHTRTTVDYILTDVEAASMMSSCCTHDMVDLNTSDHLPMSIKIMYDPCTQDKEAVYSLPKIDWTLAMKSDVIHDYRSKVHICLETALSSMYYNCEQIGAEIENVAGMLTGAAVRLLPLVEPRRKKKWRDDVLNGLCAQSCAARTAWKEAGCQREGPLFDENGRLRRAVRRRVRFCAARAERQRIQRRDKLFLSKDGKRFRTPQQRKSRCSKLVADGKLITEPVSLLRVWKEHFSGLAMSNVTSLPDLEEHQKEVDALVLQSMCNEEELLYVPFSLEEVSRAVNRLKASKAPGPDGLAAEHLKAGGDAVVAWLKKVLNAVIELEAVPDILKRGELVPVYKGGGRDPLKMDSYRGITLTWLVAEVLQFLLLERLQEVFFAEDLPHVNQTAYQKSVSCADAIFDTQESIARYLEGGSRVYMCLYDLQKAFDSIEYRVF